jgi:hypothetical protein
MTKGELTWDPAYILIATCTSTHAVATSRAAVPDLSGSWVAESCSLSNVAYLAITAGVTDE